MSGKKRKREGFDEFLKKEIMTQERYDRLYGKQMPDYIGQEESRQEAETKAPGRYGRKRPACGTRTRRSTRGSCVRSESWDLRR